MSNSTIMGLSTTTVVAGVSTTLDSNNSLMDSKERKVLLGTTIAATGSTIAGYTLNGLDHAQLHEEYARSYVESMSDEELETALQKFDLLEEDIMVKEDIKSI